MQIAYLMEPRGKGHRRMRLHGGERDVMPGCAGSSSDTPNFFASTKLLACLDLQHSQELYEAAQMVRIRV